MGCPIGGLKGPIESLKGPIGSLKCPIGSLRGREIRNPSPKTERTGDPP